MMLKLPLPRLRKGLEMKGNLRKDTLTETYIDIEGYILAATWKFWNLYGGDIEDLKGQASLIFIRAFDNYNPDKGAKLESWVTFKILKGLIDFFLDFILLPLILTHFPFFCLNPFLHFAILNG